MSLWCLTPALATHRGQWRPHNEDAINYIYPMDTNRFRQQGAIFVVADGVGGLQQGQNASHLAVNTLVHHFSPNSGTPLERHLQNIIQQLNHEIHTQLPAQSATTLTAAIFHQQEILIAHVGDSRAYWITHEHVQQLTQDHVRIVNRANGKQKAKLERAVGYRERVQIDITRHPLTSAGVLLLVTDGVTRYLDSTILQQIVLQNPVDVAVQTIIQQCYHAGGIDNITAAVIHVERGCENDTQLQQHINRVHSNPIILTLPNPLEPVGRVSVAQQSPSPAPITDGMLPKPSSVLKEEKRQTHIGRLLLLFILTTVIAGGAYVGLNLNTIISPVAVPTTTPTTPPAATNTTIPAATPTSIATTSPRLLLPNTGISVNHIVTFRATSLTYVRIGADIAAFALVENQPYRVVDQFTDTRDRTWYRLFDPQNEQNGWIQEDDLPDYQILP